jgi:hypothetical protein
MAIIYRSQGNAYFRNDKQDRAYQRGQVTPYDVNGAPPATGGGGAGTTTNPLSFDASGAGVGPGGSFNGSAAALVSYNSIGAQPAGAYLTGNQTITLSGDLSGSGTTAIAATIVNGGVTLAKMANVATATVFYRKSAGAGPPEVNTLATLKTDLGLTGTNSGDQTITLTGDVTGSGTGSFAATIAANAVTFSKVVAATAASVVGATAAGNFAQLTPAQAKTVLAITASDVSGLAAVATSGSASDLGAGTLLAARMPALTGDVTSSAGSVATTIAAGAVTLAKMANMATASLIYRKTAGAGAPEVNSLATLKTDLGLTGTNSGDQTITLTGDVTGSGTGSFSATISANAVTFGKLVAASAAGFVGALAAGNFGQLTGTQATTLLDTFTSALKGLVPASGGGTTNFLRADGTWAAPGGGTGTVTSVSVVTANGVSGSVATATTTPAITLTLGAITPTSVAASGTVTGSNLSGTNTGDTPPGGSNNQLQYKNGAAFAGAARLVVDASGNLEATDASTNTTPAADTVTLSPQRIAASGGRTFPRWQDESGIFSTLQPHIGRNSVMQFQGLGAALAPVILGGTVTFLGTLTARAPATTNRATRSKRIGQVSAATAGSTAGFYTPSAASASYTLGSATALGGGGFLAVFRWVESDAATVAGAHMFIGLRAAVVAPVATASPAVFTNYVGVAQINGGSNLNIVRGGSAAQTAIDLGASFPAAGHSTDIYELILYAPPNLNNQVAYRVERINTGDVATGVLTAATPGTQLPANTTFLGPTMFRSNNATALAVGLDIVSMYVENDI